jgi:hypothetical protein
VKFASLLIQLCCDNILKYATNYLESRDDSPFELRNDHIKERIILMDPDHVLLAINVENFHDVRRMS